MQKNIKEWIALGAIKGVGPIIGRKLLNRFGVPEAVFTASRSQLEDAGLRSETIEDIISRRPLTEAEDQLRLLEKSKGNIVTLGDEGYPQLLQEISDSPIVLYYLGDLVSVFSQPCVAIVGSRHCSTYGRNAATKLAYDLASHGVTIISGLARGIDTAAHQGTIEANGTTAAVMGTGLDDIYPKENSKLAEKISENGLLLTEFPFSKPPLPQNFPYRNRVIAGLCVGVLVIEAAESSGSLITAKLALDQGRDVYALPGNITSGKSIGTNRLIQDGAKLVMDWQDIVAEFSYDIRLSLEVTQLQNETKGKDLGQKRKMSESENNLTENEQKIFQLIGLDQPIQVDQLVQKAQISISQILSILLELEMKDFIRQLPGKNYVRKMF